MIAAAYLLSLLIGCFFLLLINAELNFYGLLLNGQFSRPITLLLNIVVFALMWGATFLIFRRTSLQISFPSQFNLRAILAVIPLGICAGVLYLISTRHPFGEWDAWAIWNLKTKFILYGGEKWRYIFDKLHWHTHPDYPLFLPMVNVWVNAVAGGGLYPAVMWTSILFSLVTALSLFAVLRQFIPGLPAFLASLILLVHPYYEFLTTEQYADPVLSFYLLHALAVILLLLDNPDGRKAFLAGILLGFITFIKNEGIVMSVMLGGITAGFLLFNRTIRFNRQIQIIGLLALGLLITSLPTIILKTSLASGNDDVFLPGAIQTTSTIWSDRLIVLWGGLQKEFSHERWCYLWPFIAGSILLGCRTLGQNKNLFILLFLIIYSFFVMGIYVFTQTSVDLNWWLEYSLARILLTLLPLWLFLIFMLHWGNTSKEIKK